MAVASENRMGIRVLTFVIGFVITVIVHGLLCYCAQWLTPKAPHDGLTFTAEASLPPVFYISMSCYMLVPAFILYYLGLFLSGKTDAMGMRMAWGAVCSVLSFLAITGFTFGMFTGNGLVFSLLPMAIGGALIPVWTDLVGRRLRQRMAS